MTRHPTRGRERPAWRTALATERWIESRASVRISILTCPDGIKRDFDSRTLAPTNPGATGQRLEISRRQGNSAGIRRDFGGISGGTSGVLWNLSWRAIEVYGTTAPKAGCRRRGLRVPASSPRCSFCDSGGWLSLIHLVVMSCTRPSILSPLARADLHIAAKRRPGLNPGATGIHRDRARSARHSTDPRSAGPRALAA